MPRSGISPFSALFFVASLAALLPAPSPAGQAPPSAAAPPGSAAAPSSAASSSAASSSAAPSSAAPGSAVAVAAAGADAAADAPIDLLVDATDARRGLFHSRLVIPAVPGPLSLAYPKWIQGEHTPTGPITQLAGFTVTSLGRTLAWQRDPLEPFVFHLEVPSGATAVTVELDYLSPPAAFGSGYGETPNSTPHLAIVDWHDLLVYPLGRSAAEIPVRARLRLPQGWQSDTALPLDRAGRADPSDRPGRADRAAGEQAAASPSDTLSFAATTLYTLLDSPLLAGDVFRTIELADTLGAAPVRISMAANQRASLDVPAARIAAYQRLPAEAAALFGARHYREYHWLVALGDTLEENGLEHHESSDDRGHSGMFTDPALLLRWGNLLPHEYVHSWNGKYRRPAGLATPDPLAPLRTDLLWVYEGLTRYLGDVLLTTRSGIRTPEQTREYLAWVAATQDRNRPGRQWRPLVDTATAIPAFDAAPTAWQAYRRGRDYYDESMLVWLEADSVLRRQRGQARSLDDFCRAFFGGGNTSPAVQPYTADDVYAALGRLLPYDWRGFFAARIAAVSPHAPVGGLEAAGWKVVFGERPNEYQVALAKVQDLVDLSFSLGLWVKKDGEVNDVVVGSPAWAAGLGPGMKLIAVDAVKWSPEAAAAALQSAAHTANPIEVTVEQGDEIHTMKIDYHGGERFPHLERDPAHPDLLQQMLAPRHAGPR
ncbi:MAG TPA: M61 family peptidase [Thermoanaerobaculia bacterium]|nr:M61 family peptidase [Thermoanaerobaculia bacterium]